MSATGPECNLRELEAILTDVDGGPGELQRGRRRYERRLQLQSGAELNFGGPGGRWWLNLSGGVCRGYGVEGVCRIMRRALVGGRCTRLDVCRDRRGQGLTLVSDAIEAARAGFLRRVRSWQPFEMRTATNELEGLGAWFGGRGSLILHRVYDKGLETKTLPAGCWHRWEVQLRDEYAQIAGWDICSTEGEVRRRHMLDAISGTIDFREGPREGYELLNKLPRSRWWSEFVGGETVQLRAPERDLDLQSWCEWARTAWVPVLVEAARRADVGPAELLERLVEGVAVTEGTRKNPVVDKLGPYLIGSYPKWSDHGEGEEDTEQAATGDDV